MKIYNYFKNIVEENISQEFRLKNKYKRRNCFLEEKKQNELINRKHKQVCTTLNFIELFLILASTISAFTSLLCIPIGVTSSAIGLRICEINAGLKKYTSINKKKKKKYDKIVYLAKSKWKFLRLYSIQIFSHDEFVLINNVLKNIKLKIYQLEIYKKESVENI